jgi:polyhydroxyalkanoate synthase
VSREVVPFKMPLKGQQGVPLRTLENERQVSRRSEMDNWVRFGRLTGRRSAPGSVMPSDLGPGATIILTHDRIAESASDAPAMTSAAADTALPRCTTKVKDTASPGAVAPTVTIDIVQLSNNFVRLIEQGCKAIATYLTPENGRLDENTGGEIIGIARTFGHVAEYWLTHPDRAIQLQTGFGKAYFDLWLSATKRMLGAQPEPVAAPESEDRRFTDPGWLSSPFLDVMKRGYLLTSQWANRSVKEANGVDPQTRRKAEFYVRQFTDALSPANFVLTNPELLRETLRSNAGNLVSGMRMLAEDIQAGGGQLKIRHSDIATFEVGRNLAITPGKVIYQNDLMQLIQYAPTTCARTRTPFGLRRQVHLSVSS